MGLGSKEAWYAAINAESLARIDLYAALSEFSKQANDFNLLTGGWVSRTFDWHSDVFEELFREELSLEEEEVFSLIVPPISVFAFTQYDHHDYIISDACT